MFLSVLTGNPFKAALLSRQWLPLNVCAKKKFTGEKVERDVNEK